MSNEPADTTAETAKSQEFTPETQALVKRLWAQAEAQAKIEEQARKEAVAKGEVSVYDVPIDQRGHLHTRDEVTSRARLDHNLENAAQDEEGFDVAQTAGIYYPCAWCDTMPDFTYDATVVRATTDCASPDGFETEFTLTVTSGKVVVSDSLRHVYDDYLPDEPSTTASRNSILGQAQFMQALAAAGCASGPVGNSCPGFYQTGPDTYAIVSPGWGPDGEQVPFEGTKLVGICTDAWTYAIADHDDYIAKGGTIEQHYPDVVEVPNGVYRFTHHTGLASFDHDSYDTTTVYASITRTDT